MDVFVYGTLTDPERVGDLLDSFVFVAPARLTGLHPVEGRYPTLAPGGEAAGRLLRTDEVAALDAYEGVDDGLYTRVEVPLAAGGDGTDDADADFPGTATVYVGDPDPLGADADWPGSGPLGDRVERYVAANDVRVVPGAADRGRGG